MSFAPLQVIKQTSNICKNAVIFLHGSGDTAKGFLDWITFLVGDISHPTTSFYFPTAPLRPYTPAGGALSNVWFDRLSITPEVPEHTETLDAAGVEMNKLIHQICDNGIAKDRIFVGGFSMGGALALHTAYRFCPGLKGVFALSSFLNNETVLLKDMKSLNTPLYMAHGNRDTMVPLLWGKKTFDELTTAGVKGEFVTLKNTMHEIKRNEMLDLLAWIDKISSLESEL